MTTLNLQVGATADDRSSKDNDGWDAVDAGSLYVQAYDEGSSFRKHIGARFTGLALLQGNTIDTATAQVNVSGADDPSLDIYCEDQASPPNFADGEAFVHDRTKTTASTEWAVNGIGTAWKTTPGLVGPIQEIVTDYAVDTLALLFIGKIGAYKVLKVISWDLSSANAPKLDIDYSEAGFVEGAVSLSGVGSMAVASSLILPAEVAFSGVGTMVVAGTKGTVKTGAAVLSGVGTMSVDGFITAIGQVDLSGVGSMAVVGERIVPGAVAMSGVGSMSAIGEVSGLLEGRADISGVGTMTVVAERIVGGKASFSGVGSMTTAAASTLAGAAAMSGVGSMSVIGETGDVLYTVFGGVLRLIDTADYPDGAQFFFEVTLSASGGSAKARLFNLTDASAVEGSELSASLGFPWRRRSSALSLPSGAKAYRVEYGGAPGGTYTIYNADVVVESD